MLAHLKMKRWCFGLGVFIEQFRDLSWPGDTLGKRFRNIFCNAPQKESEIYFSIPPKKNVKLYIFNWKPQMKKPDRSPSRHLSSRLTSAGWCFPRRCLCISDFLPLPAKDDGAVFNLLGYFGLYLQKSFSKPSIVLVLEVEDPRSDLKYPHMLDCPMSGKDVCVNLYGHLVFVLGVCLLELLEDGLLQTCCQLLAPE